MTAFAYSTVAYISGYLLTYLPPPARYLLCFGGEVMVRVRKQDRTGQDRTIDEAGTAGGWHGGWLVTWGRQPGPD